MTLSTGTVNAGSTTGNCLALVNAIGAEIAAHPSWEFVGRVAGASVAGRFTDVYHNPTTGAYIGLHVLSSAGIAFSYFLFEGFSSPNATKYVTTNNSNSPALAGTVTPAGDDSYTNVRHVADGTMQITTSVPAIYSIPVGNAVATAIGWMVSVTNERVFFTIQGITNGVYIGLLEKPVGSRWRWEGFYNGAVNRAAYGLTGFSGSIILGAGVWLGSLARDSNLDKFVYTKPVVIGEAFFGTFRDVIYLFNGFGAGYGDDITLDGINYTYFGANYWVRTDA